MQAHQSVHTALTRLLEFEEQRLGTPIEVFHRPLNRYSPTAFRPVIEVRIHTGSRPETFPILLDEELLDVTAPICATDEVREVGFRDATGQFCPLAGIIDNQVRVYFDLNELFYDGNVRRKPTNGSVSGHPGNKVADLVLTRALVVAQRNIRRYDWRKETQEYTTQVHAARRS